MSDSGDQSRQESGDGPHAKDKTENVTETNPALEPKSGDQANPALEPKDGLQEGEISITAPEEGQSSEVDRSSHAASTNSAAQGEEKDLSENPYDTGPLTNSIYADTDVLVDPALVSSLTEGFISRFLPSLGKAKTTIEQIKTSQNVLLETVQQETSKFTECTAIHDVEKTMVRAKHYHNKLLKLKRDMNALHERSAKLKKRALKLQQQKQKEELTRAHNMEKEFEKERMLTARVATTPGSPS